MALIAPEIIFFPHFIGFIGVAARLDDFSQQVTPRMQNTGGIDLEGWFTETEAETYRSLVGGIRGGTVVEVGVWKGRSISAILDICRENRNRLYAVDSWRPDLPDPAFREAATRDVAEVFRENLRLLGHASTVTVIREESERASVFFRDRSIDLLFLDADHSCDSVKQDLRAWFPKVTERGIICGHDYTTRRGVRDAVDKAFGESVALPGGSIWAVRKAFRA